MSFFDWITETYGTQLERLTKTQKLDLLSQIADDMSSTCVNLEGTHPCYQEVSDDEIEEIRKAVYSHISWDEALGFIVTLANQIQNQPIPE
ncbi:hypothetical protein [Iningainema tapete]|uniref:Uncharacterized protein n=1 Tax=Iningainema tapete BLCC-T55 TaxID=2748662 RepID=A0A8J6X9W0_9CYAN|nr:hypothetical protein [Iningainema tapete]MBD2770660.1 hypothetical protein [Iningainema tapete BLCC-T55]